MSLQISESPSLLFVINPTVNAYYHLERSSGAVFEHFSAEYRKKTNYLLEDSTIRGHMKLLSSPQRVSWLFKKAASQSSDTSELREKSKKLLDEWFEDVFCIIDAAVRNYLPYFEKEARPKLEDFKSQLIKVKPAIRERLSMISTVTKRPWMSKQYTIYLVEPLSNEYGMSGEPIFDEAISIGIMPIEMASMYVIPHELTHILIEDTVRNLVPELPQIRSSDPINEAITQLVAHPPEQPPKSKSEEANYMRLFWNKWQHYVKNLETYDTFEDFLKELFTLLSDHPTGLQWFSGVSLLDYCQELSASKLLRKSSNAPFFPTEPIRFCHLSQNLAV